MAGNGLACVIRQIEENDNGTILRYNSRQSHNEFGGLTTDPLDSALGGFTFISSAQFSQLWERRNNT